MKFIRKNRIGNDTIFEDAPDNKTRITIDAHSITVNCSMNEMSQRYYNWQNRRMLIQEAFDNLSAGEREFIMTGITPEEWNKLYSDD